MASARNVLRPAWPRRVPEQGEERNVSRAKTDDELIVAVLRGDDRVTAELYTKLFPTVDRTLCRVFGGRDRDHEDLLQTAFEQIISSIAARKFERACSLSTWASAVTSNVGLLALRSRCRERRVVDRSKSIDSTKSGATPRYEIERQLAARSQIQRLHAELSTMSPKRAEILLLHDVAGLELSEIASLTGASSSAVQSRLARGRRELLRRLSERDGVDGEEGR
jgi:RNA polymerase sigma-70 factor (ECF subfamily)